MNALARMVQGARNALIQATATTSPTDVDVRQQLAREIEALRASNEAQLQGLQQSMQAAILRRATVEAALLAAKSAEQSATAEFRTAEIALNRGVAQLEAELRETAPVAIDKAVARWRAEFETTRQVTVPFHRIRVPATAADIAQQVAAIDAQKRIVARCTALLEAICQSEALKLMTLSPEDMDAVIAAIDEAMPGAYDA